jgi:MSHA biogenesis protein MshL
MLMHPDVAGTLSVTLRGVTVLEALESIRDVYGYDFKMEGRRITIYAPSLQTRVFTINYPNAPRDGSSDLRISSGSMAGSGASPSGASANPQVERSRVSTSSTSDLWGELTAAVCSMIGADEGVCQPRREYASKTTSNTTALEIKSKTTVSGPSYRGGDNGGRSVVTSPQAGIMAVRAMPDELRQVEAFLKAARIAVERQVMLEAKIVQVELSDGYQSGIDWSALKNGGRFTGAMGSLGGGTTNNVLINGQRPNVPGFPEGLASAIGNVVNLPGAGGGLFGLALATDGFQAVLGFLETRGDIQILSSPRIATMNNQKALLKVGTDEFYVTNVSGGSSSSGAANSSTTSTTTNTLPNLTLTPFFSGIALDVTPQIDDGNNITLHIRPSVTTVSEKSKQIDLGTVGNYKLPLASSAVNESDTMVRIQDGNIVAIGGLMQAESNRNTSGLPGSTEAPFWSSLLGNRANYGKKKELVVLIKPTIIRNAEDWETQTRRSRDAIDAMDSTRARVIRLDGSVGTLVNSGAEK